MATLWVLRGLQSSAGWRWEASRWDSSTQFNLPQLPNSCGCLKGPASCRCFEKTWVVMTLHSPLKLFNAPTCYSRTQPRLITNDIQSTGFTLRKRAVKGEIQIPLTEHRGGRSVSLPVNRGLSVVSFSEFAPSLS